MFEQLVVGGKVELFKKSRRIKENGETKEMLVSQIMDINDETIICTMPSRQGKMIVLGKRLQIHLRHGFGNAAFQPDTFIAPSRRDLLLSGMMMSGSARIRVPSPAHSGQAP